MTPTQLYELLKDYPILQTRLDAAAAELLELKRSGLPADTAVIVIVCVPVQTLQSLARRPKLTIASPGA